MYYLTIASRSPEQVESYFYSHTTLLLPFTQRGLAARHLQVAVAVTDSTRPLAEGQGERLSSGLHPAAVHDTLSDALQHLEDKFGVRL